MRAVFMGSPEFAVPSLEALARSHEVVLVVTQPDRPKGRGRQLAPPPVKVAAATLGTPVLQPDRIKGNERFFAELETLEPEVIVVVAYGRILPKPILDLPARGCINVHASLLPKYRGAAPIQWAVARGETETGITIMQMDEGMDTGPMLSQRSCPIDPSETAGTLSDKLSHMGASLLIQVLGEIAAGEHKAIPQGAGATHAPMLTKEHGRIDFGRPTTELSDHVRAMDPWPGAFTLLEGEPLKVFAPKVLSGRGTPGTVLGADRDGLLVACSDGILALGELQLPGRRRMPAGALLAGRPIAPGTLLGGP